MRINDHVILDIGMSLVAFHNSSILVLGEVASTQRNPVIELHVITDHTGFSDDDTGAMIDEEMRPDRRAGVDIDPGETVGILRHDPRNQRDIELVEAMSATLDRDRLDAGVGKDDLIEIFCRWISLVGGLDVSLQQSTEFRQSTEKLAYEIMRDLREPFVMLPHLVVSETERFGHFDLEGLDKGGNPLARHHLQLLGRD